MTLTASPDLGHRAGSRALGRGMKSSVHMRELSGGGGCDPLCRGKDLGEIKVFLEEEAA